MANTNYSAGIDLNLKDGVTPVLDKIDQRLAALENSFGKVEQAGSSAGDKIASAGSTGAGGMVALGSAAVAAGALAKDAFEKAIVGIQSFIVKTFEAVKAEEQMLITVAATMVSTNSWAASMEIATKQMEKLKETAVLVGMTTPQVVEAFNLLKRTFGGTSDEATTLTNNLAVLARSYGTDVQSLAQRLTQAANTGGLMPRGVAGAALISTGIDAVELQRMKDAGQAMEYLNAMVKGNPALVEALKNSWAYLGAEFDKTKESAMEVIGQGFEPLKQVLKDLTDYLKTNDFQKTLKEWAQEASVQIMYLIKTIELVPAGISAANQWIQTLNPVKPVLFVDAKANWDEFQKMKAAVEQGAADMRTRAAALNADAALRASMQGEMYLGAGDNKTNSAPNRAKKVADDNAAIQALTKDNWAKVNAFNLEGLAKQFGLIDAETNKEIDTKFKEFTDGKINWQTYWDFRASATALGTSKEIAAFQEAQKKNEDAIDGLRRKHEEFIAWMDNTYTKLGDELAAVSDDYYTKEQANIQKSYDREKAAIDNKLRAANEAASADIAGNQALADKDNAINKQLFDTKTVRLAQEQNSIIGIRKTYEEQAALIVKVTNSYAGGIVAGWATIGASIKSTTETTRDLVVSAWGDMATAFNDSLVAVMSGKLNSLQDVFNTFFGNLRKTFATFITDLVLPKIREALGVANGVGTTGVPLPGAVNYTTDAQGRSVVSAPGKPSSELTSAQQWTAGGLAALSMVAQMSSSQTLLGSTVAQGAIQLAVTAAMIPAIGPIVGAVIAAVGIIVSALTASPADLKATYTGGNMLRAIQTGMAFGSEGSDTQISTTAALTISNGMMDMFSSIFNRVDAVHGNELLTALNREMLTYIASIGGVFGAHAGGGADFQADITKIFTDIIPKEIMHAFFGQTTISLAPQGDITGAVTLPNIPGTYGNTNQFSGVDPNSPLVGFLTNLGFTIGRINQIAGQIDVMTPEAFQKYFSGIVNAVLDFKDNIKNLSQNFADIQASINANEHPDVVGNLKKASDTITNLALELGQYTGQDQIDHATTINQLSAQYYQDALKSLQALKDMVDAINAQAKAFDIAATDYVKSPEWHYQDFLRFADPNSGWNAFTLADQNKNNPEVLQETWNQFIQLATASLNYLIGLWSGLNDALTQLQTIAKGFDDIVSGLYKKNWMSLGSLLGASGDINKIDITTGQGDATHAPTQQYLTNVGLFNTGLQDLLTHLQAFMEAVYSGQQALTQGTQADIWQNNYTIAGHRDKSGTNSSQIRSEER